MKKSLLALAVLGAFAGVASAQSSVTLFGIVDASAKYVKNDGSIKRVSLSQDGYNSSRLGFRGVEDLGGGLKAGFWIEGALNPDTGNAGGQTWQRRSTVSLMGGFGEVRLGRDYTPTFWNNTIFDAYGTNGLGSSTNVALGLSQPTFVRADNSIGYFLPSNIGGLYGQFMVAAAEGVVPGKYIGGRIGFAAGPFNIAGAYATSGIAGSTEKAKTANIGGSYDLGVVKLMGYFDQVKRLTVKQTRINGGVLVPLGQGEIRASYTQGKLDTAANPKAQQVAVGYVYNLSKRTAVYSTYSQISNKGGAAASVAGGTAQTAAPIANGKSKGVEFGVRHVF
ncbi:MAG: porin [Burkholderiales bacterium]|nr:porin [Burkholderiales bacterium]